MSLSLFSGYGTDNCLTVWRSRWALGSGGGLLVVGVALFLVIVRGCGAGTGGTETRGTATPV